MTDFYHDQYQHWFNESCRKAHLIGGIKAWIEAAQSPDSIHQFATPQRAVTEISRLLAKFDAESTRRKAVNSNDQAA